MDELFKAVPKLAAEPKAGGSRDRDHALSPRSWHLCTGWLFHGQALAIHVAPSWGTTAQTMEASRNYTRNSTLHTDSREVAPSANAG
jgi:hypothetical protein